MKKRNTKGRNNNHWLRNDTDIKINRALLWVLLSSKRKFLSETSYLRNSSSFGVFPLSILARLLSQYKLPSNQFIKTVKTSVTSVFSRMMNSEIPKGDNAVVYRSSKHGKMANGWKPVTICYTRFSKTAPQYKRWREERWKQWAS